ncbi:MAG: hypothetical protein KIS84_07715 [Dokdonella sp.]|nr:hypothetical protein [Dokdonella sp.]
MRFRREAVPPVLRAASLLAWLLLALAALRGILFIAAEPMLAVANNFDMIRVQACIDVFPARADDVPIEASSHRAPLERYRFAHSDSPCFITSELLFAALAVPGMWVEQAIRDDATFSLRWQGWIKLALLLAFAAAVTHRLLALGRADLAVGHAALVALVLCDPGNLVYFNTFYAQAAAVLFLYALLAGTVVVVATDAEPSRIALVALGLCAALLALTKLQHAVLPLAIVVLLLPLAWRHPQRWRRPLLAMVIGGVVGGGVQVVQMNSAHTVGIARANIVNTVFPTMLPESADVARTMAELGLSERCLQAVGKSWYMRGMQDGSLCPESLELSRGRVTRVLLANPMIIWRMVNGAIERMRPWLSPHLGMVAGLDLAPLPAGVPTLARIIEAMPMAVWKFGLLGLPLLACVMALRRTHGAQVAGNALLMTCCVLPLFITGVAVYGDGYVDLHAHTHLAFPLSMVALVLVAWMLAMDLVAGLRALRMS